MKIEHTLSLGFILLFCLSCSQSPGDKKDRDTTGREDVDVELGTAGSSSDHPGGAEDFRAFLDSFSARESFQLKRVKFPITATVPDEQDEGMAPMTETIDKYDWEMLDLYYDSTYATRTYDKYYQTVRFTSDTAVVEIRGIDNGIYANYYFKLIDNQWFLVTLNETSF
ncbi:DUF4348 domain-containing protein [Limibacterium fermenti]|uniref:DUF4348 domain-containing protein n=1 Tax=Limibacterium fermenti TaxID=3229863 RepID=UPI000E9AD82F|nr:hypothetical protein [Porphyromonadaceae bacterium]